MAFEVSAIELEQHFRTYSVLSGVRGQQWTFGEGSRGSNPWDSGERFLRLSRELDKPASVQWRRVSRTLAKLDARARHVLELRFAPATWDNVPELRAVLGPLVPVGPLTATAIEIVAGAELTVQALARHARDRRMGTVRDEAARIVDGALAVYDSERVARIRASEDRRAELLDRELEETRIRLWGKP